PFFRGGLRPQHRAQHHRDREDGDAGDHDPGNEARAGGRAGPDRWNAQRPPADDAAEGEEHKAQPHVCPPFDHASSMRALAAPPDSSPQSPKLSTSQGAGSCVSISELTYITVFIRKSLPHPREATTFQRNHPWRAAPFKPLFLNIFPDSQRVAVTASVIS